jgi:hypothetical protein
MKRVLCVALVFASFSVSVAAQEQAAEGANVEGGVSYQRKTVINFDDDTIEGDLKTPDGQYLDARKKVRHQSLIRIRREFRRSVMTSVADL